TLQVTATVAASPKGATGAMSVQDVRSAPAPSPARARASPASARAMVFSWLIQRQPGQILAKPPALLPRSTTRAPRDFHSPDFHLPPHPPSRRASSPPRRPVAPYALPQNPSLPSMSNR